MRVFKNVMMWMSVACIMIVHCAASAQEADDAKSFVIAGAGPSTQVIELLAREFQAAHAGYTIVVPPKSIKHAGGLAWATTGGQLFGRTGRPLSTEDRDAFPTAVELPLARVKMAFAVSKELGVSALTLEQWTDIYTGTLGNWKDVGGPDMPIMLLGRAQGESVLTAICNAFPFFGETTFVKIYDKEHRIIKATAKVPGAIGFSSKTELAAAQDLTILTIEGFQASLRVALVYDTAHETDETVTLMKAFIRSERWRSALEAHDFLPVDNEEDENS